MSYSEEALRTKVSSLNETQESIVSVAQWIMFHRRHAARTAQLWLEQVEASPASKRLNLMYLANEVVQQSKMRKKDDFVNAFMPIVADAAGIAFHSASRDVQQKLRRVVEVWRQRSIFDAATLAAVESRLDDIDKARSSKKTALGGSLFTSGATGGAASTSLPSDLAPLAPLATALTRASLAAKDASAAATKAHDALPAAHAVPSSALPAHAAQLSSTLGALARAHSAVQDGIAARAALATQLETLLASHAAALATERAAAADLESKRAAVAERRAAAEDAIMRGGGADASANDGGYPHDDDDEDAYARPEVEALTPPPAPLPDAAPAGPDGAVAGARTPDGTPPPRALALLSPEAERGARALDGEAGRPAAKRRRMNRAAEFFDEPDGGGEGLEGIDADVVGMIG